MVVIRVSPDKSIDVRHWHRTGRLSAGQTFPWAWTCAGEQSGSIKVRTEEDALVFIYAARSLLVAKWKPVEQRVPITWTECHFGGRRPWFTCSAHVNGRYCGRRVAVLYLAGEFFRMQEMLWVSVRLPAGRLVVW